jgi:DNA-binding GntR family transcriptional regulator
MSEISIDERSPVVDPVTIAAEALREKISIGVLAPGDRIFEAQMARELSINRPHVREAARQLERERLLVSKPNLGFLVREMTVGEFIDLIDVRVAVERHAVRAVVKRTDVEAIVDSLLDITSEIEDCVLRQDLEGEAEADLRFHKLIVNSARNNLLIDIYDGLAVELRISMRLMGAAARDWANLPQQHRDLAEAIRTTDVSVAEAAVEHHISTNWDEAIASLMARNEIPLSVMMGKGK